MNLPEVYKGKKANIDSYSAFFDNCKANDTGLTKQLEDAGVTDVYCDSTAIRAVTRLGDLLMKHWTIQKNFCMFFPIAIHSA